MIELGTVSQLFKSGHRIRLDVSSSNFPRFDPNPNTGLRSFDSRSFEVAAQRIHHGPELRSRVLLPTVPSVRD